MMKRLMGAVAFVAMSVVASPSMAQQPQAPLTAADVAKIKADVIKAGNDYLSAYSAQDAKTVAETMYSQPAISIGQNGINLIDPAQQMAGLQTTFKTRVAQGWVRSAFHNPTVCVVNANTALLSSKFRRYDKDGNMIFEGAEVLLYGRHPQNGWKIIGLFGHSVDKVVMCND